MYGLAFFVQLNPRQYNFRFFFNSLTVYATTAKQDISPLDSTACQWWLRSDCHGQSLAFSVTWYPDNPGSDDWSRLRVVRPQWQLRALSKRSSSLLLRNWTSGSSLSMTGVARRHHHHHRAFELYPVLIRRAKGFQYYEYTSSLRSRPSTIAMGPPQRRPCHRQATNPQVHQRASCRPPVTNVLHR